MEDIADAAGIPRATLYEYVAGREDLIDLVLTARLGEIAESLASGAADAASFAEAVVQISTDAVMVTRGDPEIRNIFVTARNRRVNDVLEGYNPAVAAITDRFLEPMLERGRASGELRQDVSRAQIGGWIRAVYTAFVLRQEVSRDEVASMMESFLLPSLMAAEKRSS